MKNIRLLIYALITMLVFSACGNKKDVSPAQSNNPSETPKISDTEKPETEKSDETEKPKETDEKVAPSSSDLKSTKYINIIKSKKYYMKSRVKTSEGVSTMTTAVNGDQQAMDAVLSDGTKAAMISKDGKNYIIDHENKMIMITTAEVATTASNLPADKLDTEGLSFVSKGTGTFINETKNYELYKSSAGTTTKFFLDKDKLLGIESTASDGTVTTLEIIELTSFFPSDMFVLPSGYQEYDLASSGG